MDYRDDKLKRAYARLKALKENLPSTPYIPQAYIEEHHGALDHLEQIGHDIREFRIPQHLIRIIPLGTNPKTGLQEFTNEVQVERSIFLVKLDAVLSYFAKEGDERVIGFRPGRNT
jgi:hypothetical protein